MSGPRFTIVFSGKIQEGHDEATVKKNFARLFKLDAAKVERYFSGRPVVVKKDVDEKTAQKFKAALESAGALPEIRPVKPAEPDAAPLATTCPRCGAEGQETDECKSCGVIISKFLERTVKPEPGSGTLVTGPNKYYEHSSKFGVGGLVWMALFGVFGAVAGGGIYGQAIYYIPLVYLNFLITIIYGVGVGFLVSQGAKMGKVRNTGVLLVLGLGLGLLAEYTQWVSWLYAVVDYKGLIYYPSHLYSAIKVIAAKGAWNIKGWTPKGTVLYIFWFVEALIIVGAITFIPWARLGVTPFCERCDDWIEDKIDIQPLQVVESPASLQAQLERGDFSSLMALPMMGYEGHQFTRVELLTCPTCRRVHLMSVAAVTSETDDEGKKEEDEDWIVLNMLINSEAYETLKAHWGAA